MDDVLIDLHLGAWWKYTDWDDRTYANLRVSEGFDYTLPTEEELNAQVAQLQEDYDAKEYQRKRKAEYPIIADQLDDIYHNGIDGWKATIKITKDKYPKG